jgi:hypothetical protein
MARKSAVIQFSRIMKKLETVVSKEAVKASSLQPTGDFAASIIVKRTRLGYGVDKQYGSKQKFAPLAPSYIKQRKMFAGLNPLTTPKRSNLTRTGQMLDSVKAIARNGVIYIEPTGRRDDGKTNLDVAIWNHKGNARRNRPPRVFMNLSRLEFNQTVRFYRKTFTDLLRKLKVI